MTQRMVEEAAAQLRRLLLILPTLADGQPHLVAEIARQLETDEHTLRSDLQTLVTRYENGGRGYTDDIQLLLEADTVELHTNHFMRPMGLLRSELRALELGLVMLRPQTMPHELRALEKARERIHAAAMRTSSDDEGFESRSTEIADGANVPFLAALRSALRAKYQVTIHYHSANATAATSRTVHPYGTVYSAGRWYLIAHCEQAKALRVFRIDRISGVEAHETTPATIPKGFSVSELIDGGRVLLTESTEFMRVRYSPRIARWIRERGPVETQLDGSVIAEHALADDEWAVQYVLQYGPEAVVLAPERIRMLVARRLEDIATARADM